MTSRGLDRPEALELHLRAVEVLEQAGTVAEDRDEVDLQLVDQLGLQVMLGEVRATPQGRHPCRRLPPGLVECRFGAVGDEGEGGPPRFARGSRGWWVMTKTGMWKGGSSPHQPCQGVSPHGPAPPNMFLPITVADVLERLLDDLVEALTSPPLRP